jgi:hypothetical protein
MLDEFDPSDHVCRVIEAFVVRLNMSELGFDRSEAADTASSMTSFGRPTVQGRGPGLATSP